MIIPVAAPMARIFAHVFVLLANCRSLYIIATSIFFSANFVWVRINHKNRARLYLTEFLQLLYWPRVQASVDICSSVSRSGNANA